MGVVRGRRLPENVRAGLGLAPSERVLAWAVAAGGEGEGGGDPAPALVWVVTRSGLRPGTPEELTWDVIAEGTWREPELRVRPLRGADLVARLHEGHDLAAQVRARVEASIVCNRRVALLPDGRGALVVARRVGRQRDVVWSLVFDPGVDAADPLLRQGAMTSLARVRAEMGL